MNFEKIQFIDNPKIKISSGSTGIKSQINGVSTMVSSVAIATGGMKGGSLFVKKINK